MESSEHEALEEPRPVRPADGGSLPPGGDGSPPIHEDDGETPTEEQTKPLFREQLVSIAVASVLVVIVVWIAFKLGYETKKGVHEIPSLPKAFWVPIAAAIAVGFVAPFGGDLLDALIEATGGEAMNKRLPDWVLQALVYVLTSAVAVGLTGLVARTGGFTESPFTPLMTAPAAIGPFMAQSRRTIVLLSVFGILSVWLSLFVIDERGLGLTAESWVVGLMSSSMLFLAGGLSWRRHKLEENKRKKSAPADIAPRAANDS